MINLLKALIGLGVILTRFYLVFRVIQGLYFANHDSSYNINNIQWFIYVLILDMYVVKILANLPDNDIYTKTETNEEESNSRS